MKTRLTIYFSIATTCMSVIFAYAQPPGSGGFGGPQSGGQMPSAGTIQRSSPPAPEKVAEQETNWMKKKLKLRAHQIPDIEDLNFQYAVARTQLMQQLMTSDQIPAQSDFEKMKTSMEVLQAEKEQKLQPMLTEEQWATYQKKKKNLNQTNTLQRPQRSPMDAGRMPSTAGSGFPRQK